ncbi:MAG TPA: DNA-3-methyladenine glycosylase [Candidatus Limnocylindria bacterium]|jgi:DNA-3-methyladenine glycosylase|nr:DNA-3-methyladenine glycosylase [Candidatus Limnocylindria bacterium]
MSAGATPVVAQPELIAERQWFDRSSPEVARDLLGALLIHDAPEGLVAGRIVEVEAYTGPEDQAAHSSHGRTPRNAVMFGPPGHLYVYLIYGMHHCLNVVCGPGDKPEAVLIRAVALTDGLELAHARRGAVPDRRLASGPGNVARAFGIDRSLNGVDLLAGPVRLARGSRQPRVVARPRIGVDYAGEWALRPMRFLVADDPHVSRR